MNQHNRTATITRDGLAFYAFAVVQATAPGWYRVKVLTSRIEGGFQVETRDDGVVALINREDGATAKHRWKVEFAENLNGIGRVWRRSLGDAVEAAARHAAERRHAEAAEGMDEVTAEPASLAEPAPNRFKVVTVEDGRELPGGPAVWDTAEEAWALVDRRIAKYGESTSFRYEVRGWYQSEPVSIARPEAARA
jgi:hypothetical protein